MKKKKSIFISCEEANHNCDKTQYNEASFWQKIKLNIHLIYCRACREYSNNNTKLTNLVKSNEVDYLNTNEKQSMKESFAKELQKHTH